MTILRRKLNIDQGSLGFTNVVVSDASVVVVVSAAVVVVSVVTVVVVVGVVVVVVVVDVVAVVVVRPEGDRCVKMSEANCSGPRKKLSFARSDFFIGLSAFFAGVNVDGFRRLLGVMTMLFRCSADVDVDRMLLTAFK